MKSVKPFGDRLRFLDLPKELYLYEQLYTLTLEDLYSNQWIAH